MVLSCVCNLVSDARWTVFRKFGVVSKCLGRSYWLAVGGWRLAVVLRLRLDQARMVGRMVLLCMHVAVLKVDANRERFS